MVAKPSISRILLILIVLTPAAVLMAIGGDQQGKDRQEPSPPILLPVMPNEMCRSKMRKCSDDCGTKCCNAVCAAAHRGGFGFCYGRGPSVYGDCLCMWLPPCNTLRF
ncbi:uncharacterized protein LOC112491823 [Ziziphus jujuba]|uniref:Uncharacterized protein LOC112491823 n=1 Tax=Ziziphus jujuba TaxID=326968 RepID=A0A6P6G7F1_ZIZJJ|nr:uncharacterized protein LOC112491823 [Ziziphus jujuba]